MKDSMIIYASYADKFKILSDEQFGRLMRLMFQYQIEGKVPMIEDATVSLAFDVVKFDLDRNNEKYEEICEKRRIAGKAGGLAKANNSKQMIANASKSKQNVASVADNDNDNDNDNDTDNDISIKSKAKRFTPPTLDEVKNYCKERNNNVDAERFIDFYASKGWKVGNQPMKDWKACVRTWERRDKDNKSEPKEGEYIKNVRNKYAELEKFYLGEV